ncbi:MAG: J domain-containing protein [Flammeovirgaceae bacterium]
MRLGYYQMAKKYHPDLNTHTNKKEYETFNTKFQLVNQAY